MNFANDEKLLSELGYWCCILLVGALIPVFPHLSKNNFLISTGKPTYLANDTIFIVYFNVCIISLSLLIIYFSRALYVTLFKHLLFVGGRACYRTALEFCKLLLSLDPDGDPLAVKLTIDFYALRAKEYSWLIDFAAEFENTKNLSQLPNFAFSIAIANFYTCNGITNKADELLQEALLMFPSVLMPLLEKCSIQADSRASKHGFFSNEKK